MRPALAKAKKLGLLETDEHESIPAGRADDDFQVLEEPSAQRSVHVTLSEYAGHDLINVRVYSTGDDGIDRPPTKGISMAVDKLPALAAGLAKALEKAKELGLVDGDAS